MDLIKRFKQGNSPISANFIDYHREGNKVIRTSWGMGGSSSETVDLIPDHIDGYKEIKAGK